MNAADVAWPPLIVTGPGPTCTPPKVQSGFETKSGPQTKNLTVPVTGGGEAPEPDSVAVSVTERPPSVVCPKLACVVKTVGIGRIPEAFSERSWLPS